MWDSLTDINQANVTNLIAGKRNANVVQALMTNFEDAQAAMETAANSTGSAFRENEKYMDSIAGRLDVLKAQFEEFSQSVIGSTTVKAFASLASHVLSFATALSKIHVLLPALVTAFTLISGRGLANDVAKIVAQTQMLITSGSSASNIATTLSNAMAGLSARQKVLLKSQLESIIANAAVSDEYKAQIGEVIGLINADTGLAAANHGVATSFKAVMASIPVWGWIALGVSAVVSVISAIVPAINEGREAAIDAANTIIQEYSDANKTYSDNIKTLNGMRERFSELSEGVDENGKNIGLTKSEYEEY